VADLLRVPKAAAAALGHYVYLYIDPRDNSTFYVGKGRGTRAIAHLKSKDRKRLTTTIRHIRAAGLEPRIEILRHRLKNEQTALDIESALIDALTLLSLTNKIRGQGGAGRGRASLPELIARYTGKRVAIKERVVLIRINRAFRPDMPPVELYDATRSAWKVGPRRDKAQYAFAVYEGVVREVYAIEKWLPGGKTFNTRFGGQQARRAKRWEFVGTIAPAPIRKRYLNAYVGDRFKQGAANPIAYVNVPSASRRLTTA
jgi:hypothetical protein